VPGHWNSGVSLMASVVHRVFLMNEMSEHCHVVQNGVVSHVSDGGLFVFLTNLDEYIIIHSF
jgi:hypothetical protein